MASPIVENAENEIILLLGFYPMQWRRWLHLLHPRAVVPFFPSAKPPTPLALRPAPRELRGNQGLHPSTLGRNTFPKTAFKSRNFENGGAGLGALEEPGKSCLLPWEKLIFKAIDVSFEMQPAGRRHSDYLSCCAPAFVVLTSKEKLPCSTKKSPLPCSWGCFQSYTGDRHPTWWHVLLRGPETKRGC